MRSKTKDTMNTTISRQAIAWISDRVNIGAQADGHGEILRSISVSLHKTRAWLNGWKRGQN
jgi:hypothetical protein